MPRIVLLLVGLALFATAPAAHADHREGGWDDGPAPLAEEPATDGGWDGGGWDEAGAADPVEEADADWDVVDDADWGDAGVPEAEPEPRTRVPAAPALPTVPVKRLVPGRTARLRTDGKAAIPRGAPKRVRTLIAAANQIVGKPYKWGGGHVRLFDSGYDCSGAVSYALIRSSLLRTPMVSGQLAGWDRGGAGRWVTIYANKGHVYLEVAGLRLDTSPVGDPTRRKGVRWRPVIGRRPGFAARHPAGL
jgi:hypothetical protein